MDEEVELRGEEWGIVTRRMPAGQHGYCRYATNTIEISPWIRTRNLSETIVHELLHALYPFLCEDEVEVGARELTKVLCQLRVAFKPEWVKNGK